MPAADNVQFTKTYVVDHWFLEVEVLPVAGGVLPKDVFIFENTGTTTLGPYAGTCDMTDLQRLQVWAGQVIKKFGNRYVRADKVELHLNPGVDVDSVIAVIKNNLSALRSALLSSASSTQIIVLE